jgi:hypothetical protein
MRSVLVLLAMGGVASSTPLPASYVGWWAYRSKGTNTRCRLVDAKLDRELHALSCRWSKPEATRAVTCELWVAYREKNACLEDRSVDEDSEGDQH